MTLVSSQPHTATVKRPDVTRDADSNVATRDYAAPASETVVPCLFQTRGGALSQDEEGNTFTYDAILYITDEAADVQPDDLIEVTGVVAASDKFRATGREPKADLDGVFSHYEIPLTRATER